jgi:hypothetical protein
MKWCLTFLGAACLALLATFFAHGYAAILNKDDHKEIHIVPAPGKVTIDGDLGDWDLSGSILMYLEEGSKNVYSVRGAMMYDQEALYIGGHVKDPSPLINHYSFADDPGLCWDADAVQLRFISDPAIRSTASLQTGGQMPAEQQKNVCHLTLWHSTRDKKPGFFICYTLNFTDGKLNPPGVQGAYRKDADGKGYTFEYRVPWTVLRAPRPLRGGDQVQVQWQQHWGLDVGRGLRCGLTDIRNPASGDLGYMGPTSWGLGIFEKTGRLKLPPAETAASRPEGHIPILFNLKKDSRVSLAVCDSSGKLVRTCLGAHPLKAGKQAYLWDGLDDRDRALPAGKYTYKMLLHEGVKPRLVCDIGVSGTPPYQTEDGTGGWAGDYSTPWNLAIADGKELTGVESLQRRQGVFEATAAQAAQSQANAKTALRIASHNRRRKTAFLPRLAGTAAEKWLAAQPLPIVLEGGRSALAWLGYDDKNLYARFQVQSDVPLLNTPTDPKLLFKSGSALDIQLGSELSNRPVQGQNVQVMAEGDVRLLVSRTKEGKMVATLYRPKIRDTAKPNKARFQSPTGQEEFDEVVPWNELPVSFTAEKGGYAVEVAIPWARLGLQPNTGLTLLGDIGAIFGNQGGTRNAVRYLWSDKSPEVSINNDIPSEVRIHPNQWGKWVLR